MFLDSWHRRRRFQRLCEVIAPVITQEAQLRVNKTLEDAYARASAQGAPPEDRQKFNQGLIDRTNQLLSKENGVRIREWAGAILDQESQVTGDLSAAETLLLLGAGFLLATLLLRR